MQSTHQSDLESANGSNKVANIAMMDLKQDTISSPSAPTAPTAPTVSSIPSNRQKRSIIDKIFMCCVFIFLFIAFGMIIGSVFYQYKINDIDKSYNKTQLKSQLIFQNNTYTSSIYYNTYDNNAAIPCYQIRYQIGYIVDKTNNFIRIYGNNSDISCNQDISMCKMNMDIINDEGKLCFNLDTDCKYVTNGLKDKTTAISVYYFGTSYNDISFGPLHTKYKRDIGSNALLFSGVALLVVVALVAVAWMYYKNKNDSPYNLPDDY
jgi:hypothetical protein